mmetsp:Transcript_33610/g.106231  ORF Transcript_33610/g.106231 Transcript_33610/m.106231 type:complete len:329 (-) Transcript_33610:242-1228(-)
MIVNAASRRCSRWTSGIRSRRFSPSCLWRSTCQMSASLSLQRRQTGTLRSNWKRKVTLCLPWAFPGCCNADTTLESHSEFLMRSRLAGITAPVDFGVELLEEKFMLSPRKIYIAKLMMDIDFWKGRRSEFVLVVQDDVVLCRTLDLAEWESFAYVGAPWLQRPSKEKYKRIAHWQGSTDEFDAGLPLDPSFQWIFVGDGALSLRNVEWMIKAIETCPYDGIHETENAFCVAQRVPEDYYFGITLAGMHAPLPTRNQAYNFSINMPFPKVTLDISKEEADAIVPVGVHKPWKWNKDRQERHLENNCKYYADVRDAWGRDDSVLEERDEE